MPFREQLQASLHPAYIIERELGGGGMSRVYLAEETAFGRHVVVKLLSPELVAGVNVERFMREIQMAARLQHPHIVPVITAGDSEGLPWYTMPFVEGESLRAKLSRQGALGIGECIAILRDVARALDYAHDQGIVHRDIKPDNVLLSRGVATVADFGIAKAISASRTQETGASLTQIGVSIGTPMYMAPEQAAGDPDVDQRADIYAYGCVAYEMLTGHGPFAAKTPQRLIAAHMSEVPRLVSEFRPDTPRRLADLVMRCLEKDPAARPSSAAELLADLESATSEGAHPAAPPLLLAERGMLLKALALYSLAIVVVAIIARKAVLALGLPDWVFPGAMVAMALALPAILFTGYAQRVTRRAFTQTPTYTPGGSPSLAHGTMATMALNASPHLSWRRTARWSAFALGTFVLLVGAAMTMGAVGHGPFATLLSAGELKRDDPVLIAEFALNNSSDTTLGRVIAEAVRTDLTQSGAITVLPESDVRQTLTDMQKPNARVLFPVAREVAERRGVKALVDGSLTPVGAGFVVMLRLVTADSVRELAKFTGAANSPADLILVVGDLTRKLREKMGESLKSVRASPPLWQVTTSSLLALRKYTESRAALNAGDRPTRLRLLNEAIAADSNFGAAYISLASDNINRGVKQAESAQLLKKVHELRDRLGERDRLAGESYYYQFGPVADRDPTKVRMYEDSMYNRFTTGAFGALSRNSAAIHAELRGDNARADSLLRVAARLDPAAFYPVGNLLTFRLRAGRFAAAESTYQLIRQRFPAAQARSANLLMLVARKQVAAADSAARYELASAGDNPFQRADASNMLADLSEERGALDDAKRYRDIFAATEKSRGVQTADLTAAARRATNHAIALGDTTGALRVLDSALAITPLKLLPELDRPYAALARAFAAIGRPDRARPYAAGLEAQRIFGDRDEYLVAITRAEVAMAERRWDDALKALPDTLAGECRACISLARGMAYDGRGTADSAIHSYEQYASDPLVTGTKRVLALQRLGELYEAKGNVPAALRWYRQFVESWNKADPALQPQVADVRRRIARLEARERSAR